MKFAKKKPIWILYNVSETLPTIKLVKLIGHKKFVIAALDLSKKTFIVHIAFLNFDAKILIHLAQKSQIALLFTKKVVIPATYLDYTNVLLKK